MKHSSNPHNTTYSKHLGYTPLKYDYKVASGGMMENLKICTKGYRYGFNGQEKDDEVSGAGNSYTAEFWQYDPRLGRRPNRDPFPRPDLSDYATFGNNPIVNVDPDGAYFFGLIGSTSEQRRTARDFAAATGGTIKDITKKSISVDYTVGSSQYNPETKQNETVIEGRNMKFLPGGGFNVGNDWENLLFRGAYESSLQMGDYNMYTGYPKGSGALAAPTVDPVDLLAGGLAGLTRQGLTRSATKNVTDDLLTAANSADRGGLTAAGRALQKHGSREGSVFPKATGSPAMINAQAEEVVNNIVTHPNVQTVTRHHARFGNVTEFKIPGGQGARFSGDGKKFIGFIE